MSERVAEERKSIKKVLREQVGNMQVIVEEMDRTNVNNYPLKPHILRNWVEVLREGLQEISESMDQAEEASKRKS